jgi:hypothetical protein
VIDDIMGDFAERYNDASTLGKVALVSRNAPRIVAALVAAGVTGAFAGMTDLLLFQLLGLDRLKDFAIALKVLGELTALIPDASALGNLNIYGAVATGIKLNPAHHKIPEDALARLAAAAYKAIRPLYKTSGGANAVLNMEVSATDVAPNDLLRIAEFISNSKLSFEGADGATTPDQVLSSFMYLTIPGFLRFLEANRLISYSVTLGTELSVDAIDPALLDTLFS